MQQMTKPETVGRGMKGVLIVSVWKVQGRMDEVFVDLVRSAQTKFWKTVDGSAEQA